MIPMADTPTTVIDYESWRGKLVWKKSRRPFKSTALRGTVYMIVYPPALGGEPAFLFDEDDSCVPCNECELSPNS